MKLPVRFLLALGLVVNVSGSLAQELVPWSFKPLQRPAMDPASHAGWARDDLDRLIADALDEAGLKPNADADRATLLRRAAFDLTGLPPTPEELDRFLGDPAPTPEAFAKVVDGYLASPRFGERWGRHWLDVARYADSVGRTWNAPFPYAWKYRDWVIASFKADKPYHRFIAEQIAGDLLPANTVEQRRDQVTGTGFLALGSLTLNAGGGEPYLLDQIDDQIDVTTRGFLGLSIACARCHDHKYDPVLQRDYYALAGIFRSSWTYPGQAHQSNHTAAGYLDPEMLVRLPADLAGPVDRVREIPQGIHTMGDLRQFGGKAPPPYDLEPDWVMGMREGEPRDCELRVGGVAFDYGEAPPRGDLGIPELPDFPDIPADASGRFQLAQWIASPQNPLTARVMTNRVWHLHFGQGLVATPNDFGVSGAVPSHPELLDWLAARFMAGGWSVKSLHRLIVTSAVYRQSSAFDAKAAAIDADNRLLWRFAPRRLEAEAIRDAMLAASGQLNRAAGGPSFQPFTISAHGSTFYQPVDRADPEFNRRTVYRMNVNSGKDPLLDAFDCPDPAIKTPRRGVTTTPLQALELMNNSFVQRQAGHLADRGMQAAGGDVERAVQEVYRLALGREPTAGERGRAVEAARDRGLSHVCWALLNSTEFVYVR